MRKIAFGLIGGALLALGGLSTPASAMTAVPANGLTAAWDATASVQDVQWRGRGWGWHRHHHWGRHHGWRRW